jgi:2-isopropylmalate synthase
MLPDELSQVVHDVLQASQARIGIHCHNDTGCAIANSMAAIEAGATHVQGTLNGYGERTGNADLVSIIANLELKKDKPVLPVNALREAFRISHAVAEVTNVSPSARQPYVGVSAFAHKAGLARRSSICWKRYAHARFRDGRPRIYRIKVSRTRC